MKGLFRRIAARAPAVVGAPWTFFAALAATVVWIATGAWFDWSGGWVLWPATVTSVGAFLLVLLLQYTQNRDTRAVQLKLDELIRSLDHARTQLVRLEQLSDEEIAEIEEEFQQLRAEQHDPPEEAVILTRENWDTRPDPRVTRSTMAEAKQTTNHGEIQRWVEDRGGRPAAVTATGSGGDPGILRIDFGDDDDDLEQISWDEFFRAFDDNELVFLYSDERDSRFNKFISRETAETQRS